MRFEPRSAWLCGLCGLTSAVIQRKAVSSDRAASIFFSSGFGSWFNVSISPCRVYDFKVGSSKGAVTLHDQEREPSETLASLSELSEIAEEQKWE